MDKFFRIILANFVSPATKLFGEENSQYFCSLVYCSSTAQFSLLLQHSTVQCGSGSMTPQEASLLPGLAWVTGPGDINALSPPYWGH